MESSSLPHPIAYVELVIILFAICSFAGWLYETVENFFTFGGIYLRAQLMLPWCPIYGIGALIIVAVLEPLKNILAEYVPRTTQIVVIVVGIYLLAAIIELAGSYVCEAVMGFVPWDYSHAWGNFQGRIAPAYTLRFVVMGLIALYAVFPWTRRFVCTHPHEATRLTLGILVALVLDFALQSLGVWNVIKDALVPLGINHW